MATKIEQTAPTREPLTKERILLAAVALAMVHLSRLAEELVAIRVRGWAVDDEERTEGMRCVAAPIYDEHEEPLGAISLAGPSTRLRDERIRQLGPVVSHFAEEITRRLGGRWPHPH